MLNHPFSVCVYVRMCVCYMCRYVCIVCMYACLCVYLCNIRVCYVYCMCVFVCYMCVLCVCCMYVFCVYVCVHVLCVCVLCVYCVCVCVCVGGHTGFFSHLDARAQPGAEGKRNQLRHPQSNSGAPGPLRRLSF